MTTKTVTQKVTLENIGISIQSKRNRKLDQEFFPFENLLLSEYDIRENRQIGKLKDDLLRDGQLQPLTVNINTGEEKATVVNGRTRYLDMNDLNIESNNMFEFVSVEVYENLTQMEQDYLNAQINVTQSPLTANEKLAFVDKYKDDLDPIELGEALGLSPAQVEKYKAVSKMSTTTREKYTQKTEGYGRGDINIETAGDTILSYESENDGVTPDNETLDALGDKFNEMNMTRDIKRKLVKKVSKETAKLKKDVRITSTYTTKEIVEIATSEATHNNNEGGSGNNLPKNSSEKYKIVDKLLKKEKYDFSLILFAESLYRINDEGKEVESETKRIIDKVCEVTVVGNEIMKLTDIKEYGDGEKKKIKTLYGDAITNCKSLGEDTRKGFIYVNGASLYAQRPEFMNYLKKKYPNSTIVMVVLDLLFGKSQVAQEKRNTEIITIYGGVENFNEVLTYFKKSVKKVKFKKYAETPQEKYIAIS